MLYMVLETPLTVRKGVVQCDHVCKVKKSQCPSSVTLKGLPFIASLNIQIQPVMLYS